MPDPPAPTDPPTGPATPQAPLAARDRLTPASGVWSPLACAAATLALAAYTAWAGLHARSPWHGSDTDWYVRIAAGDTAHVLQPFASRQLGPLAARALAALFHLSLLHGFGVLAAISLLTLSAVLVVFTAQFRAPWWILLAFALTPMLPDTVLGLLLPDLFYAALLALLLVLLERRWWLAAAAWMLPLMVARESTSLTLVCLLIAAWKPLRRRGRLLAGAAAAAGAVIVHHLTLPSPGNKQHLPESLYMLLKVPWNATQNLFGVRLWNNVNDVCGTPAWQHAVHLGNLRAVGFCDLQPAIPRDTLLAVLTEFGILPVLVLTLWLRRRAHPRRTDPSGTGSSSTGSSSIMLRFAALYGVISFLIAPLLGTAVPRLLGYAWPLFFVVLPAWLGSPQGAFQPADHPPAGPLAPPRRHAAWLPWLLLPAQCVTGFAWRRPPLLPAAAALWAIAAVACWLALRPLGEAAGTALAPDPKIHGNA